MSPITASLQFSFKGYPVPVTVLKIDTLVYGGYGEKAPLIIVSGNTSIPTLRDSLSVVLTLIDSGPWAQVANFIGLFADTAHIQWADLSLISYINGLTYDAAGNGVQDFYLTINSNAADTLKATFYGTLIGVGGNSDSTSMASVTNGVFQLNY